MKQVFVFLTVLTLGQVNSYGDEGRAEDTPSGEGSHLSKPDTHRAVDPKSRPEGTFLLKGAQPAETLAGFAEQQHPYLRCLDEHAGSADRDFWLGVKRTDPRFGLSEKMQKKDTPEAKKILKQLWDAQVLTAYYIQNPKEHVANELELAVDEAIKLSKESRDAFWSTINELDEKRKGRGKVITQQHMAADAPLLSRLERQQTLSCLAGRLAASLKETRTIRKCFQSGKKDLAGFTPDYNITMQLQFGSDQATNGYMNRGLTPKSVAAARVDASDETRRLGYGKLLRGIGCEVPDDEIVKNGAELKAEANANYYKDNWMGAKTRAAVDQEAQRLVEAVKNDPKAAAKAVLDQHISKITGYIDTPNAKAAAILERLHANLPKEDAQTQEFRDELSRLAAEKLSPRKESLAKALWTQKQNAAEVQRVMDLAETKAYLSQLARTRSVPEASLKSDLRKDLQTSLFKARPYQIPQDDSASLYSLVNGGPEALGKLDKVSNQSFQEALLEEIPEPPRGLPQSLKGWISTINARYSSGRKSPWQ